MKSIAEILSAPGCEWFPAKPGATEEEINRLAAAAPFTLPAEYIELLRYCTGGEGELDAAPLLFMLDGIDWCIQCNQNWRDDERFEQFWFFGSNGGLEQIAFDLRSGSPFPIVMIDPIAGERSAKQIATSMSDFISKLGRSHPDSEE